MNSQIDFTEGTLTYDFSNFIILSFCLVQTISDIGQDGVVDLLPGSHIDLVIYLWLSRFIGLCGHGPRPFHNLFTDWGVLLVTKLGRVFNFLFLYI